MDAFTAVVLATLAGAVIGAGFVRTSGMQSFRRLVLKDAPASFRHMLARSGLSADDAAGRELEFVTAMTLCASCKAADECSALLHRGRVGEVRTLCPNDAFLSGLEATKSRRVPIVRQTA